MVQLSTAEHSTVEALIECIGSAMHQLETVDPAYSNKTKLQKLLYLAIDEFDLSVTYSWYLAGAVTPNDAATPANLQSTMADLPQPDAPSVPSTTDSGEPDSPSDTSSPTATTPEETDDAETDITDIAENSTLSLEDESNIPNPILFSDGTEPDASPDPLDGQREDIIEFYISVLPDVWQQNTMRFLQNFYLEHAPDEFQELYVTSTHLRTRLRDVEKTVAAHLNGDTPNQELTSLSTAIGQDISDLHCSIRQSDALDETFTAVVAGTDMLEDGLMMLANHEADELQQDHLDMIETMQEFFYYWVWRYPCLIISKQTAQGPSATDLREARRETLTTFEEDLVNRTAAFEDELATVGLRPGPDDYQAVGDEVDEAISSLADQYFSH